MENLRSTALSGAFFTALGQASRIILQVASIVVLARLLTPGDFGLFAMVSPALMLAVMLSEGGLGSAIIQRSTISHAEFSSIFWITAAASSLIAGILFLAAPKLAAFYDDGRVAPLAAASGMVVVVSALSSPFMAILNRNLQYKTIALIEASALFVATLLALFVAVVWRTYWALWVQPFGTAALTLVLSAVLSGWHPGRGAPLSKVADMLRVGWHVMISRLFDLISRNFDKALIGRVRGSVELGFYDRAYRIVLLPILFIHIPLERLLLPMLVRTLDDPARYRRIYALGLQFALLVAMPVMMIVIVAPQPVVHIVLGPEWSGAASMFRWLAAACLLQLATHTLGPLLISQGRSSEMALATGSSGFYSCGSFLVGIPWGADGVAIAYALSEAVRTPIMFWWASRKGPVRGRDQIRVLLPFIIAAALCAAAVSVLRDSADLSAWLFLLAAMPTSAVATLAGLALTGSGRNCLGEVYGIAKTAFRSVRRRGPS